LEGRVETPTRFENMEDQMLRKKILTTHQTMSSRGAAETDIAAVATVLVSSEDPRHPIDYAFDGQRGPGASRWIAAQSGEQALILAFDTPQTIRKILVEVEEPEISRTQEMAVSISQDGGQTYRELMRQEYNFSPPGTTLEHEEWSIKADAVSHLQLRIKPDKGGKAGRATLTTLALE
jgi:F5/8 type C domain